MKGTKYFLPLLVATVCLAILLLVFFLLPSGEGPERETQMESHETKVETGGEKPIELPSLSFRTDLSAYESAMTPSLETASEKGYFVLANKDSKLTADFAPEDLIPVKDARKEIELRRDAALALEAMFIELRANGCEGVFVTSAYRTYSYQNSLFHTYMDREMRAYPSLSREEAREKVLRYSAEPGTSEHQTGLCVDLMCDGMAELDESFASYPVYTWLEENAWKFGFILRYPSNKTEITRYDYEPWHYRFVGRTAAYEMHLSGECLEEYLKKNEERGTFS